MSQTSRTSSQSTARDNQLGRPQKSRQARGSLNCSDDGYLPRRALEGRKAAFSKITIKDGSKERSVAVIEAYFMTLTREAARGDAGAARELRLLNKIRYNKYSSKKVVPPRTPQHLVDAYEKQERLSRVAQGVLSAICTVMLPEIYARFDEVHGPLADPISCIPDYIDREKLLDFHRKFRKLIKTRNPQPDYEVGYKKTPEHTRFTKDDNPSSRRGKKDLWKSLDEDSFEIVQATGSDGVSHRTTKLKAGLIQLFRKAIEGDRMARSEVRKLIVELEARDMLSPPPSARRARRRPLADEKTTSAVVTACQVLTVQKVKADFIARFTKRYGEVPDLTTDYERRLPGLNEIEGWTELWARHGRSPPEPKQESKWKR